MSFIFKSILILTALYVPYLFLLRKESFFKFNRLILLAILGLSLILPFVNLPFLYLDAQPLGSFRSAIMLDEVVVRPENMNLSEMHNSTSVIDRTNIIATLYVFFMVVVFIYKAIQLVLLHRHIHQGVLWTERIGNARLYCHAGQVAPFSWMNTIVISEEDYNHNASTILRHELGHIHRWHSLDIILVNICQVIQWINPFAWMIANSLHDVHEYEADDTVLRSGVNVGQYQRLLIKKAVGSSHYAFANSFNHSLLKNRITMMLRKKSNPWMRTKSLYLIPVAAVTLTTFATPVIKNKVVDDVSEDNATLVMTNVSERPSQTVDIINNELEYAEDPAISSLPIPSTVESGLIPASSNAVLDNQEHSDTEEPSNAKAQSLNLKVQSNESFEPVPVDTLKPYQVDANGQEIYSHPEKLPEYEGGMLALMQFLSSNLRYPQLAHDCGVQATILVTFKVNKDGSCSDFEVTRCSGAKTNMEVRQQAAIPDVTVTAYTHKDGDKQYLTQAEYDASLKALSDEALRVCKTMPKWTPGYQKDEPVITRFTLPIAFRLQ